MPIRLSNTTRSAMANALAAEVNGGPAAGTLEIYSGAQPASAQDAASGALLATATFNDPAFGDGVDGVITLSDPPAVVGSADGVAGWFRVKKSSGETVFDGGIPENLNLGSTAIAAGVAVDITGGSLTMPAG